MDGEERKARMRATLAEINPGQDPREAERLHRLLGLDAHTRWPNSIPRRERIANSIFSALLFAYGSFGVWVNDLYLPGKGSRGIHLHDVPAWMMYGAMMCACLVMLSVVVDHYDHRPNERHYRRFAQVGKVVGWCLFGASLLRAVILKPG